MASCILDVYKIIIKITAGNTDLKEKFKCVTEVVKFLGYRKLFEKEHTEEDPKEESD
jgi:DNA topoisomerase IA